jgi:hypothetical protein
MSSASGVESSAFKSGLEYLCYGLGPKCLPKSFVMKTWSLTCGTIQRWWNFRRWDLDGRSRSFGAFPWRIYWDLNVFSLSLLSHFHKVITSALLHHTLCHGVLPHHKLKSNGASWSWTETSEKVIQNKSFIFISKLSQVFSTAMKAD